MQDTHSMFLLSSINIGQMHIYISYSNGKSVTNLIVCEQNTYLVINMQVIN